jgi:hypothetical protein
MSELAGLICRNRIVTLDVWGDTSSGQHQGGIDVPLRGGG